MDITEITSVEELETAIAEARKAAKPLADRAGKDELLSPDEREELRGYVTTITDGTARIGEIQAEEAAAVAEQRSLLESIAEPEPEAPAAEVETPAEETPVAEVPVAEPVTPAEPVVEETNMPEAVAASAAAPVVRRTGAQSPVPVEAETPTFGAQVAITAAASMSNFAIGQNLDMGGVHQMLTKQAQTFRRPQGEGPNPEGHVHDLRYSPVAQFNVSYPEEFRLTDDEAVNEERISAAIDHKRTMGNGKVGLTAAGGWCAPSEILYNIPVVGESLDGMVSIPEMEAKRGGVKSAFGPDFATLYAGIGFEQTEAEAIAGDTKDCYELTCPSFTETRLDVKGICLIVPILTEAGYPEAVDRVSSGALVVHAHKMNFYKLAKMEAASTPVAALDLSSTAESTLHSLELRAEYMRQAYRMAFTETLEVVLPHWVRPFIREDFALRMGLSPKDPILDADIDRHFAARNLAVQWVYDWQTMTNPITATVATSFKAMMYPAGTFLGLTKSVISLSAVYDAASLSVNTYTGTFTEEGIAVRKMSGISEVVTIPICSRGRVGAANLTCA